ncbi:MAG: 50S ribosomal protein L11 methyltransferase, partial [Chitinophagaceae bacterium]
KGDTAEVGESFDIILANINKNVILENLQVLASQLAPGGILLLSGLLVEDEAAIVAVAGEFSLQLNKKTERNKWISLRFNH